MTTFEIFITTLTGVATGGLSSYLVWWYLQKYTVPELIFAPEIAKTKIDEKFEYKIRIKNTNKSRKIIDCKIIARFYVEKFEENSEAMLKVFNLEFRQNSFPYIKNDEKLKNGKQYDVWEHPFKTLIFREPVSSSSKLIKKDGTNYGLNLESLFEEFPDGKIKFVVFAHDSFTGTKKMISSKFYSENSIVDGKYRQFSLELIHSVDDENNKV